MTENYREVLILFDDTSQGRSLEIVNSLVTVTQILPPRLALAQISSKQWVTLSQIDGVIGVYSDSSPSMDILTPIEQSFVKAWLSRPTAKRRPGNQVDWDAPGFLAPDKNGSGEKRGD
jgi:hypothetical protein